MSDTPRRGNSSKPFRKFATFVIDCVLPQFWHLSFLFWKLKLVSTSPHDSYHIMLHSLYVCLYLAYTHITHPPILLMLQYFRQHYNDISVFFPLIQQPWRLNRQLGLPTLPLKSLQYLL